MEFFLHRIGLIPLHCVFILLASFKTISQVMQLTPFKTICMAIMFVFLMEIYHTLCLIR